MPAIKQLLYGDRSFTVASPELWNTLPVELHQPETELNTLQRLLKSHLFKCDFRFNGAI